MSIANKHFGAEIITKNGKVFKFDDMHCLLEFKRKKADTADKIKETFLVNFEEPHNFIAAPKAFLLKSNELHSPMGGNIAAFNNEEDLKKATKIYRGKAISWENLNE